MSKKIIMLFINITLTLKLLNQIEMDTKTVNKADNPLNNKYMNNLNKVNNPIYNLEYFKVSWYFKSENL